SMAQFDSMQNYGDKTKSPTTPTFEQLLREDASKLSPSISSSSRKDHDAEEDHSHHPKKSVLAKVREKAKKLRHSLSNKKKHCEDENSTTPSWGVTLEEEEDEFEDPEYFGAPMYESEFAPENCKEAARQHPRTVPVTSEEHVLANKVKPAGNGSIEEEKEHSSSPNKTLTETVSDKLAPAYATVSDATQAVVTKIQGLIVTSPEDPGTEKKRATLEHTKNDTVLDTNKQTILGTDNHSTLDADNNKHDTLVTKKLETIKTNDRPAIPSEQLWDKGVSVKEYIMNKLEPGEDERALSQVIVEAMSPRKSPREGGVVGKMKEAVTSLIWSDQPSQSTVAHVATNSSSSNIPISTNAHE
ncbi:hypothetical protein CFOL_v3_21768, partial [Cephalotus follicularis]